MAMDTTPIMQDGNRPESGHETPEARERRLAREAEMIAVARAQLAAGQGRRGADLDAWLDTWEADIVPAARPTQ
jgi:hypothetical protein